MSTEEVRNPAPRRTRADIRGLLHGSTLYICAAIGGFVASVADLVQKEDASAIQKMSFVSSKHLSIDMQPVWILLILVVLATALCFVFQPTERKQSFGIGIGIIAAIMTITPYKAPLTGAPPSPVADLRGGSLPFALLVDPPIQNANAIVKVGGQPGILTFSIQNATREEAVISVSVLIGGRDYFQKNIAGPSDRIQFAFEIPDGADRVRYVMEVNGDRLPTRTLAMEHWQGAQVSATVGPRSTEVQELVDGSLDEYQSESGGHSLSRTVRNKLFRKF